MISCYQEILHERKCKERQLTLDSFIDKKLDVEESKNGTGMPVFPHNIRKFRIGITEVSDCRSRLSSSEDNGSNFIVAI
ncbi:hypothetical protein T4A_7067 [Trichinella pseudospiralis]|uniref:Uncharacterized protein n=1 Tax=Trichinella pseudospiralis TaxID=6337 RepID=A0A0V1F282_TRIPS|nr:hypothetical protein T4A_7067 [Trichinella pseudospiralis]